MTKKNLFPLGVLGKPHALNGYIYLNHDVYFRSFNLSGLDVYINDEEYKIEDFKTHLKNRYLVKFKGLDSINEIVIGHEVVGNGSNTITLGNADNEETHLTGVIVLEGYTFTGLPAGPVTGMRTYITDGGTPTYGGNASGGGSNKLPVFYNGSNWIYA